MQRLPSSLDFRSVRRRLRFSTSHQPALLEEYRSPHITIGGIELKAVHQITYLGCTITLDAKIDRERDNRLAKANSAFSRLYERVWNSKHLKKGTKISVYWAVIVITLLYGSESYIIYRQHLQLLECFHQRCLFTILNIHWSNYVSNVEVFNQAEITSIEAMLVKSQLCWAGHVSRMGRPSPTQDSPVWWTLHWPEGHQRNVLKTPSRRPSVPATLTTASGQHLLLTISPGTTPSTRSSPPLKTLAGPTSGRNTTGGRSRQPQQPYQTFKCSCCSRTCLVSHQHACNWHEQPPS